MVTSRAIFSRQRMQDLLQKAVVEGNIYYNTLEIERGAHVAGNLVHEVPVTNVSAIQQNNNADGRQD